MKIYKKYERGILVSLPLFLWIFLYFIINDITQGRVTNTLPNIADKIPFIPFFVLIYFSTYLLVFMPYFFIKNLKDFKRAVYSYMLAIVISSSIFLIYPVTVARDNLTTTGFFNNLMLLLHSLDKPYNAFPSLHIALSTIAALVTYKANKNYGLILFIWTFLIALSTLFIKQHYILDIVAGFILAMIVFWIFNRK